MFIWQSSDETSHHSEQFFGRDMSIKVLIVEDNQDYRELVSYFLLTSGYEVVIACDGQEAVELAKIHQPNIILMDLNLPVMDGWTATQTIKDDPDTRDIPILAISANCGFEA